MKCSMKNVKLTEEENNFKHSLKKCFDNFQFLEHEKNNDKETKEKSIFDVLSDGIYLLTMFVLIVFLFPFFVYIYLNLFYEKKTVIENNEKLFDEKEPEEDNLQNIDFISIIAPDKKAEIRRLSESNANNEIITIGPVDKA